MIIQSATIQYLLTKKHWLILGLVFLVLFILVRPVSAGMIDNAIYQVLGWIASAAVFVFGNLLIILIEILIWIFRFDNFIDAPAVEIGWVIVRDLANITLVVALIIAAARAVFQRSGFNVTQMLVKIIVAAVLINFSRLIAGFLIDFGQVIMMTFVHSFSEVAAGNLTYGFGIQDMLSVAKASSAQNAFDTSTLLPTIGALALAVLMLIVACAVILVMIVVLLQRVILLWIYTIFAPVAFIAPLLPGTAKFSGQWWGNFSKQVFIGPTLAFFFWLAMSLLSNISSEQHIIALGSKSAAQFQSGSEQSESLERFASAASSPQKVFDYMVTVAILLAGLGFAKSAGGYAGGFAGNVAGRIQGGIQKTGRYLRRGAFAPAKGLGKLGGAAARKAHIPHMAAAIGQRVKTSKAGRLVGMDREYSDRLEKERKARELERLGGRRFTGAVRATEEREAAEKQKELSETGAIASRGQAKKAFQTALNKGGREGKIESLAIMKEMARNKWLAPLEASRYAEKYGGGLKNLKNVDQRTAAEHIEALWDTQGRAGDELAGYSSTVGRNQAGQLVVKDDDARGKKVRADFAEKGVEGMRTLAKSTSLTGGYDADTGEVANRMELQALLGTLDIGDNKKISKTAQNSIGRLTQTQRKFLRDYITGVIAKSKKWGLEDGDKEYEGLMDASQYLHEDIKYTTTGDVQSGVTVGAAQMIQPAELKKKEQEINTKLAEQRKEVQILGLEGQATGEKFTKADKMVGTTLLNNVDHIELNKNLNEVGKHRNETDKIQFRPDLLTSARGSDGTINKVYNQLLAQAQVLDKAKVGTKQVNEETGLEMSFEEVLNKSRLGKIKQEMSALAVQIRLDPRIDVEKAKKHVTSLLDQLTLQAESYRELLGEHMDVHNFVPGLDERRAKKRSEKQVETRTATVSGLAQAGGSISKLTGPTAITDKMERIRAIEEALNIAETVVGQNKRFNPDKQFVSAIQNLVNMIKTVKSEQKEDKVNVKSIGDLQAEISRLGERFRTK